MFKAQQIAALKYLIFKARNRPDLAKQVLAFLIDKSENMTREVCLVLVDGREGYTADEISAAAMGIHGILSTNGDTHLNELCTLMDCTFRFSFHSGQSFSESGDRSAEYEGAGYTFWLARERYSQDANLIQATRDELEQIDLRKPGLYRHTELA